MPRMIVLNGPPACGKSTMARMYVDEHPLSLNLDIDRIRGLIGCWRNHPQPAGLLARAFALAGARVHLCAGHDVVIPQFLGRAEFLNQAERLADEVAAEFHELVLFDSKENTLHRFAERSRRAADPAHLEAQEMLDRAGGMDQLAAMYDQLVELTTARPRAKIISTNGYPEQTYRRLLDALD